MSRLRDLVAAELSQTAPEPITAFAAHLAAAFPGARAVMFYGSILRTGDLSGVLDYYVLTEHVPAGWRGVFTRLLWPDVSYHELEHGGATLRAKVASMTLAQFQRATSGAGVDTTIWARFVQPSALIWADEAARETVIDSVTAACRTAAGFAQAIGPADAAPLALWTALFQETYKAELRVEKAGREVSILTYDPERYERVMEAVWADEGRELSQEARTALLKAWRVRRALGKPLNVARLVKAAFTFQGAARYAAWKIQRHTGVTVEVTPWRERHPILAAPGVLLKVWRERRQAA
ncbi:hypothetical protein CA606_08125 [Caulobacter vibrioides]|uniref:Cytosolic protein n=1 Tax=Caulobacter vibrioides TaxID=155892 RepID=A0A290MJY5_CAUVI|nr:hypothetical protein [Caulobacter vibrioides]ATC32320.1 hypothetical protein CA606_08125 [Caulobacter vibrioides]